MVTGDALKGVDEGAPVLSASEIEIAAAPRLSGAC
jgi:hypothetical protein